MNQIVQLLSEEPVESHELTKHSQRSRTSRTAISQVFLTSAVGCQSCASGVGDMYGPPEFSVNML